MQKKAEKSHIPSWMLQFWTSKQFPFHEPASTSFPSPPTSPRAALKLPILPPLKTTYLLVKNKDPFPPLIPFPMALIPSSQIFSSPSSLFLLLLLLFLFSPTPTTFATTFTLINRCDYTIWPGILSSAGSSPLSSTGLELPSGASQSFEAPSGWSGRFWGRTQCSTDPAGGQFRCSSGDCGSGRLECNGAGAIPPATLAEFTVGSGSGAQDFYDVSLVDGYNLPLLVEASGGSGSCSSTGCVSDLNKMCPQELRVENGDACRSACEAFGTPEYCCSGELGTPDKCGPTSYSQLFKSACPRAYSYAYDDGSSTFTCTGAVEYKISFCPSLTSQKSTSSTSSSSAASNLNQGGTNDQTGSGPVVVTGGGDEGAGSNSWLSIFSSAAENTSLRGNDYSTWQRQRLLLATLAAILLLHL